MKSTLYEMQVNTHDLAISTRTCKRKLRGADTVYIYFVSAESILAKNT